MKNFCTRKEIQIFEITEEILNWFFRQILTEDLPILATPKADKENRYWSLWIPGDLMREIKAFSEREQVSYNRIIYSAFKHWMSRYIK